MLGDFTRTGVAVALSQSGQVFIPADGCPNSFMLIGRHADSIGGATYQNSQLHFFTFYSQSNRMSKVWVIHRIWAVRSKILDFVTLGLQ